MRYLLILILLAGCAVYPEGQLVITKKYVGRVQYSWYDGRYTQVVTDRAAFKVCDSIHVPDSVHCYIRTTPVYMDVAEAIARQLEQKYFLFGDKEYRIKTW